MGQNSGRLIGPARGYRAAGLILAIIVGGCSSLIALAVPSQHQSLDIGTIPSGRYVLDRSHASVHFEVDHMGYSTFVGRFDDFSAEFQFDSDNPSGSALDVRIDPASVSTGVEIIDSTLQEGAWFDVEDFPEARFTAKSIDIKDETSGQILGRFEFRGQSHPLTIDIIFNGGARDMLRSAFVLGFSGTAVLSRSEWGMTTLLPLVSDEVRLNINAEFVWKNDPVS